MNLKQALGKENTVELITETKSKPESARVNINTLISRYKKEKAKEKTETYIFVGLACTLVIISGIIVTL